MSAKEGEAAPELVDRLAVEEVCAVLQGRAKTLAAGIHSQGQIERGLAQVHFDLAHPEPLPSGHLVVYAQIEEHVEERRAAGIAHGLQLADELLERQLAVGDGFPQNRLRLAKDVAECGPLPGPQAQGQGVDKHARHGVAAGAIAAGIGRPDDQVVDAADAAEETREQGEEQLIGRRAQGVHGLLCGRRPLPREAVAGQGTAAPDHGRIGSVGGQRDGVGRTVEDIAPVSHLALQALAGQRLALAGGELQVACARRRLGDGSSATLGVVESGQVSTEQPHGPAVGDDVMEAQD